jgi:hypothetical protein
VETSAAARSTVPVTSPGATAGQAKPVRHIPLDRPCRTDFGLVADGRQVNGARHGGAMAEQATCGDERGETMRCPEGEDAAVR